MTSTTRFKMLLETLPRPTIMVIGDVMLDEYVWGHCRRISPEAPVPVLETQQKTAVPGGAANVAANIVALGGVPLLLGVIGEDDEARKLTVALREGEIDPRSLSSEAGRKTTVKTRLVAQNQQIARMDWESLVPPRAETFAKLRSRFNEALEHANACVISDYGKGVVNNELCQEWIQAARRKGIPVVVDPKGSDYDKYRDASILKPNFHEFCQVFRAESMAEGVFYKAGADLVRQLKGSSVLVTRGPQGMHLFRDGHPHWKLPSQARNVFDVTGAGDTVVSVLALTLASNVELTDAVQLANLAAGLVVGKFGTATTTRQEVVDFLAGLST